MIRSRQSGTRVRGPFLLVPLSLLLFAGPTYADDPKEPSEPAEPAEPEDRTDDQCIECHNDRKLLEKEDTKKQWIDMDVFSTTTHGDSGCTACHTAVTTAHPKDEKKVEKPECDSCHEETATEYKASKHADDSECKECHNPHDSRSANLVTSLVMNAMCEKCHEKPDLLEKHAWLPRIDYHLAALPCVTCHTASPEYVIAMYVEKRTAGPVGEPMKRDELRKLVPEGKPLASLIDTTGDGKVTLNELRAFNRRAARDGLKLQAMMMPAEITHNYDTLKSRFDCTFCHAKGPDKKQKAFLAFPEEDDNRFVRVPVQEGAILDILAGTPDFYMIGASATRNSVLNLLGFGLVGVGMCFAGGHSFFRLLTMGRRRKGGRHNG